MPGRSVPVVALALLALLALAGPGCGGKTATLLAPNTPPELRLDPAPRAVGSGLDRRFLLRWDGRDPDGRVVAYRYAFDPPSLDRPEGVSWVTTTERQLAIALAGRPLPPGRDHHAVVVQAVDDRGAVSAPRAFVFFGENIPPSVQITSPQAVPDARYVPPDLTIHWTGIDPDGTSSPEPVQYKYRLFHEDDEEFEEGLTSPDQLRLRFAPGFAGWDSLPGDSTSVRLTGLVVGDQYLFVVVGIDEDGAHTAPFQYGGNMLHMMVSFVDVGGLRIRVFSDAIDYTYPAPSVSPTPIRLEVAGGAPLTFHWTMLPSTYWASLSRHRWVLDPEDLLDETPRSGEHDLGHWSAWSGVGLGEARLPGFPVSGPKRSRHHLYIETEDDAGLRSRAWVEMIVVPPTPTADLLIVDDTRLAPDRFEGLCRVNPSGVWPMAAELDTFLFARGGFPISYGCQVLGTSTPGLFAGFAYDTLGTLGLRGASVPLSTLAKYRHVVWITDAQAAINSLTGLRQMSQPGVANLLATYLQMGGNLWLVGGGAAYASSIAWNNTQNDGGGFVFSSLSSIPPELQPGRFMWTLGWRSELATRTMVGTLERRLARNHGDPVLSRAPLAIQARVPGNEPLPPGRISGQSFYNASSTFEYLREPNEVLEGDATVLDTLYRVRSATLPDTPDGIPKYIAMTRFRSPDWTGAAIFSGFNLWSFDTAQLRQLVDFVLEDLWGYQRLESATVGSRSSRAPAPRRAGHRPRRWASSRPSGWFGSISRRRRTSRIASSR